MKKTRLPYRSRRTKSNLRVSAELVLSVGSVKPGVTASSHVTRARSSIAVRILLSKSRSFAELVPACTYTSTKSQRTAGAPRTKILEDRLRRARALIDKLQKQIPVLQSQATFDAIFDSPCGSPESADAPSPRTGEIGSSGVDLENMMDGLGRLSAADNDTFDYFGGASGFAFLQRTQQIFENGEQEYSDAHLELSRLFDSPLPNKTPLNGANLSFSLLLPSRHSATRLFHVAFRQTYPLFQFLHEATFQKQRDRIYDVDSVHFTAADHNFLPLFYSTMAIGYLFDKQSHQSYRPQFCGPRGSSFDEDGFTFFSFQ